MTYDIVWMRAAEGDDEHRQEDADAERATLIRSLEDAWPSFAVDETDGSLVDHSIGARMTVRENVIELALSDNAQKPKSLFDCFTECDLVLFAVGFSAFDRQLGEFVTPADLACMRETYDARHAEIDVEVPSADVLDMLIAQRNRSWLSRVIGAGRMPDYLIGTAPKFYRSVWYCVRCKRPTKVRSEDGLCATHPDELQFDLANPDVYHDVFDRENRERYAYIGRWEAAGAFFGFGAAMLLVLFFQNTKADIPDFIGALVFAALVFLGGEQFGAYGRASWLRHVGTPEDRVDLALIRNTTNGIIQEPAANPSSPPITAP